MPKLTINGKEVEVPKGTRVIEAAKKVCDDVPFYCYHPGLSIAGNCRMCLVEVEKSPKLQIACHMEAQDGMVVRTDTERVKETRKHVLEFLLVNHPVDCPVCDQAGECWLQDYYMNYAAYESRLNENKVKKKKAASIGPHVMLDTERCILCSRCVRFCDEVSKTSELGILNRGDHAEIAVFPGQELDNPYSGNVVDICPVGALTDKDFRFKVRVWYLKSQDTLCNGCARGCNISMQYRTKKLHHAKGERVMRLKPRFNEHVNKWWMCDEGRYGYKFHDHNRILEPIQRQAGQVQESSWEKAVADAASRIEKSHGNFAVFLSPQLSNEELFLAGRLFVEKLKARHVFLVSPNEEGFQDDILIRADKNPNTKGAQLQGLSYNDQATRDFYGQLKSEGLDGIIVFGQDLLTLHQAHLNEEQFKSLKWSLFIGSNHNLMSEYAGIVLPSATYAEKEGTFTNFEGRVQRFYPVFTPLGDAKAEWQILVELAEKLGTHYRYEKAEDIFEDLAAKSKPFEGLTYEALRSPANDIRIFAAPMIPSLEQDSGLIFYRDEKGGGRPAASSQPKPVNVP